MTRIKKLLFTVALLGCRTAAIAQTENEIELPTPDLNRHTATVMKALSPRIIVIL